ncbi:MAG: amino acid ABC transporter permease [Verrucomicrobiota bacterium]
MPRSLRESIVAAALFLGLSALAYLVFTSSAYKADWETVWERRESLWSGFLVTLFVSIGALLVAVIVSVLLVCGQRTWSKVLTAACQGYIELIRGTPLLVQLLIGYYVFAPAFNLNSPLLAGVIVLACFSAAYLAEIIRGGIDSIPNAQREAARAVGFTTAQAYRFVIIPQTIRRILPAAAGEFANLIKNSSLLSVIAVSEITKEVRDANAITYVAFEFYLPLALGYLILTIPIAIVARRLEARFAYAT